MAPIDERMKSGNFSQAYGANQFGSPGDDITRRDSIFPSDLDGED